MNLDLKIKVRSAKLRAVTPALVAGAIFWSVVTDASADSFSGLPDPTQPAYTMMSSGSGPARPSGPELQSTFISASQRRAVISGRMYRVGDKLGSGTITEILPYEVVMKHSERETRLRLLPKLAKETVLVKTRSEREQGGVK